MNIKAFLTLLAGLSLMACALPSLPTLGTLKPELTLQQKLDALVFMAKPTKFKPQYYQTEPFKLFGMMRLEEAGAPLTIYIEGDSVQETEDPTPTDPLGFKLALKDPSPNTLWLSRPCQYSLSDTAEGLVAGSLPQNCRTRYWGSARFSEEIIRVYEQALSEIAEQQKINHFHLVGYDGGAAIALLLASRLNNRVKSLRTIAGNVDPVTLASHNNHRPPTGSLSPTQIADQLTNLPQYHYVGEDDEQIPPWLARRLINEFIGTRCGRVLLVEDAEHIEDWLEFWPNAANQFPICR